jgi:hypothetical protein
MLTSAVTEAEEKAYEGGLVRKAVHRDFSQYSLGNISKFLGLLEVPLGFCGVTKQTAPVMVGDGIRRI